MCAFTCTAETTKTYLPAWKMGLSTSDCLSGTPIFPAMIFCACLCKADPMFSPYKKLFPEFVFKLHQLFGQGGLGHMQRLRCCRDASLPHYGKKITQNTQFHKRFLPSVRLCGSCLLQWILCFDRSMQARRTMLCNRRRQCSPRRSAWRAAAVRCQRSGYTPVPG